jgi:hypothetical protein
MELEITPEPSPEERKVLERALAHLLEEGAPEPSTWWRVGLEEALSREEEPA